MKKSLRSLDWMIKVASQEDLEYKTLNKDKPSVATEGEGWWVYHLKTLRELIILENVESRDSRPTEEEG